MLNMTFDIIRYLFVIEVNTSLAYLSKWPAIDLSLILGETIADRLSIVEAREWKKALSAWNTANNANGFNKNLKIPRSPWPINAVIFWYPAKRSYGKGEIILFELKLLGEHADHSFFVEVILPAMEQIAMTPFNCLQNRNPIWGHFDIRSVYSAIGNSWKQLLKNGHLDLRHKVTSKQWSKDIKLKANLTKPLNQLRWISPFKITAIKKEKNKPDDTKPNAPQLFSILEALAERLSSIILGKFATAENYLETLDNDARLSWKEMMSQAERTHVFNSNIEPSLEPMHGFVKGYQTFSTEIPDSALPYLWLATIIHIGEYAHFGCGTYVLE